MRIGRLFKTTCLFVAFVFACAQAGAQQVKDTTVHHSKYLSIGATHSGICFGNSHNYAGFRFNLLDKKVQRITGFNIAFFTKTQRMNGLALGIVADNNSIGNGIAIGGAFAGGEYHNGIVIGGLAAGQQQMNGVALGGLFYVSDNIKGFVFGPWSKVKKASGFVFAPVIVSGDTLNGLFIGGDIVAGLKDTTAQGHDTSYGKLSGLAIAIFRTAAAKLNGMAITLCYNDIIKQLGIAIAAYNSCDELHGIQIGLLNHAANNPKGLRWLPFINMHFGR